MSNYKGANRLYRNNATGRSPMTPSAARHAADHQLPRLVLGCGQRRRPRHLRRRLRCGDCRPRRERARLTGHHGAREAVSRHGQGRLRRRIRALQPEAAQRADGIELRRSRQRRLSGLLSGDRVPAHSEPDAERDVPQPTRQGLCGCLDGRRLRVTCRKDTASSSPTSITTATRTSSRKWAAPFPATKRTTSSTRTRGSATTGSR